MDWLKAHWPLIGSTIAAILPFEMPSIKAYIAANPHTFLAVLLAAVVAAYYAQSPLTPKQNGSNQIGGIGMKLPLALFVLMFLAVPSHAQTPAPATEPIEITASAVSLPGASGGTLAATLAGMQVNVTPNVGIESVNFISSGANTNAYMAGYSDRHIGPLLSKALNNSSPWLNGYNFRVGLHADAGIARISDTSGNVRQHFSALFGGQFDYAIKGSPTWSLAARVDDFFTKGLPHHHNLVVALGPVVHF